jgi:hypothetical protein
MACRSGKGWGLAAGAESVCCRFNPVRSLTEWIAISSHESGAGGLEHHPQVGRKCAVLRRTPVSPTQETTRPAMARYGNPWS